MKIMFIDEDIAKEITKVETGGIFEHKKERYDVADNRKVFGAEGLAAGELFELVIEYGYVYFVAKYARIGDLINFEGVENGRVKFVPMVREVQISHKYKNPKEVEDIFDPEEVVKITKQLHAGKAFVRIDDNYSLVNQVINRRNGCKVEASVYKESGVVGTKDIVNMEAFLKVMEKTHIIDYSISFAVEKKIPSMILKINIGIEKSDWEQQTLFDDKEEPEKLEIITITNKEDHPSI